MANNRLPQLKAVVSGAAAKNPQRFRDRKASPIKRAVGNPYATMTPEQCEVWHELAENLPWLNAAHRPLLRLACHWGAKLNAGEVTVSGSQQLGVLLSKLGATPVDETRVTPHGEGEQGDGADEFFGKGDRPN